MSQEEFEALMPNEFWREVVDRVAVDVPGTLLLAEAFWLLEGYFVRTLGMHRVYNSAFMNMLRDEENAKYRSYLKKTVEFDPDILKRYVNFMSNPDERTAIDQFGSGDKFFGCCVLLATLPGLPMFGHGQVEGFTERYGMEYKQAKMREVPDERLVTRHQNEIAPLLKRRWQFAESENFLLYDFWTGAGTVDENVFAYSNRSGSEPGSQAGAARSVIVYNNAYSSTAGTLHHSAASIEKGSGEMKERSLAEGLALEDAGGRVVVYRDAVSGLEYLRRTSDVVSRGLSLPLRGYQYAVLLDWRELQSTTEKPWDVLADALGGSGVPSVEGALQQLRLRPLTESLRQALSPANLAAFTSAGRQVAIAEEPVGPVSPQPSVRRGGDDIEPTGPTLSPTVPAPAFDGFVSAAGTFFDRAADLLGDKAAFATRDSYLERCRHLAGGVGNLGELVRAFTPSQQAGAHKVLPGASDDGNPVRTLAPALGWLLLAALAVPESTVLDPAANDPAGLYDQLDLRAAFAEVFAALGLEGEAAWQAAANVRLMLRGPDDLRTAAFWADGDARWLAGANESAGVIYVNKEQFEELVCRLSLPRLVAVAAGQGTLPPVERAIEQVFASMTQAGYDLDRWLTAVAPSSSRPAATSAASKAAPKKAANRKPAVKLAAKPSGGAESKIESHHKHKGVRARLVEMEAAAAAPADTSTTIVPKAAEKTAAKKTAAKKSAAKKSAVKKSTRKPK